MDALKAELARKRKAAEEAEGSRPQKYMRRGDIERMKAEAERAKEAELKKKQEAEEVARVEVSYPSREAATS